MKTYFVDAFTTEKFKGNPAAVCFPEKPLDKDIMQKVAFEIGFSETAFVVPIGKGIYSIRFFTPLVEIPLCGHATLAASKVIFDSTLGDHIEFVNVQGISLHIDKNGDEMNMIFPVYTTDEVDVPSALIQALGIIKVYNQRFNPETNIILLEIESCEILRLLHPDFNALVKSHDKINGVLVTSAAKDGEYDFHYRYFWPWAGTHEDPVTGGVQTFLTKYWADKLQKTTLRAFQSSHRTGVMTTQLLNDKVRITGNAVTVLEGQFKL